MAKQPAVKEGFVDDDNVLTIKDAVKQPADVSEPETIEQQTETDEQQEPDQQPFEFKWPMRIRLLHRPIRNNKNEEIREITFREPTGGDINRYGAPVRINADGMFDIDDKKMAMMMAGLSGINLPFLERMDPRDWQSCVYRLKLFFHPDASGWL